MKKFFFCAAAAIVALASCSKTQVVYNDAPQEIGFKAVTGAITKAEQSGEQSGTLRGDMGVFAFVNEGKTPYFSNIMFTGTDVWTGGQYWPLQSSLDFVVYAPHGNVDDGYKASYENNTLTVANCDNSVKVTQGVADIDTQIDYLYGAEYYDGADVMNDDGTTNTVTTGYESGSVATSLKHALAKITINFTGSNVTVNSVSLQAPHMKGTYTVNYSSPASPVINWTSSEAWSNGNDILLQLKQTGDVLAEAVEDESGSVITAAKTATASIMVVPAAASDIIVEYKVDGSLTSLFATAQLDGITWAPGTHYVYNINITPNAIQFNPPTIADWTGGAASNPTIQ